MNLPNIIAIACFGGIAVNIIGNILNDVSFWIAGDIYFGIVFAIAAILILKMKKGYLKN